MEVDKPEILEAIRKAQKGKQKAFNFLLDTYWNLVYGYQIKRVKNEYEAEDITIESFAKAFDKIDSFNTNYPFGTWIVTISKNIQIDKSRKKTAFQYRDASDANYEKLEKIPDITPTAEDKIIREQNLAQLLKYIKQLKPAYQDVINFRYFQEMSYNEISESLGEPLNNVKVRLLRARKLLLELITKK